MLSIMDPVDVDDLVVYRDDENPCKFYLLPDEPIISTDDQGVPDFYFIQYRGVDAGHKEGGYVQFRTVLTISADRRARVIAALTAQLRQEQAAGYKPFGLTITSTDPLLADPIWTSGTVSIMTMQAAADGLVTASPDAPLPCDLAGSLGASGRLSLSPDGASIFWASFTDYQTKKLPILITYQLVYRARVSATLTISAEGSTVINQFWERAEPRPHIFSLPLLRYVAVPYQGTFDRAALSRMRLTNPAVEAMVEPAAVTKAIRSSVTDKTINVVINTDEGTGADAGSSGSSGSSSASVQDALFKLATDLLTNDVIPAIFGTGQGGAPPQPQPGSDSSSDPGPTKQLFKLPSEDTNSLQFHINMTSNSVIDRHVNPNGALQVLIADPAVLAACFKQLTLGNDFFSKKHVTISTAGIDFAADGISVIEVSGRYNEIDEIGHHPPAGPLHPDVVLKSSADTGHWDFALSRDATGVPKNQYEYSTKVYYNNMVLSADWQPTTADGLIVNPAAMGAVRVQLALTAKREDIRSVSVALSYRKANGDVLSDVVILTPDDGRKTWIKSTGEVRPATPDTPAPTYTYQLTYDTIAAGQIALPAQTSSADTVEVPTPFPKTLTVNFTPQGSFANITAIVGQVTYDDEAHGYRVVRSFSLPSLTSTFSIDVPVLDGGPEQLTWIAHIVHPDGSQTPLPAGHGPSGTYSVGLTEFPPFKVTVMPDLIDFDKDVQLAAVKLTYHDQVTASDLTCDFKFTKGNATQMVWSIPQYAANLPHQYDIDIRYFGFDRTKNAEFHLQALTDPTPYLDRTAGASTSG